jgi:hypothetical protein
MSQTFSFLLLPLALQSDHRALLPFPTQGRGAACGSLVSVGVPDNKKEKVKQIFLLVWNDARLLLMIIQQDKPLRDSLI